MKLLDKIKDLFMDEVVDDDEIEIEEEIVRKKPAKENKEIKKILDEEKEIAKMDNALPKVMQENIKQEETKKRTRVEKEITQDDFLKDFSRENNRKEKEVPVSNSNRLESPPKKFIEFSEFDLEVPSRNNKNNEVSRQGNVNVLEVEREATKKVVELYPKKEEIVEKPRFKATPVISPVYGILDKNYTKEEVKERDDNVSTLKRPSKKVDFEMVRKKAFGNLADDIKENMLCENCELYKEVKKITSLQEDDLLYDMTVDDEKDVTISKAYDNYQEFGVAYEPKPQRRTPVLEEEEKEELDKMNLDDIINNTQKLADVNIDENPLEAVNEAPEILYNDKIDDIDEKIDIEKKIDTKEEKAKEKEDKVDEDFFDLIDSMYKERTDD